MALSTKSDFHQNVVGHQLDPHAFFDGTAPHKNATAMAVFLHLYDGPQGRYEMQADNYAHRQSTFACASRVILWRRVYTKIIAKWRQSDIVSSRDPIAIGMTSFQILVGEGGLIRRQYYAHIH